MKSPGTPEGSAAAGDTRLQALAEQLLQSLRAGRVTIRVGAPGAYMPIRAEALASGARSLHDYSMDFVLERPTPMYERLGRGETIVQDDTLVAAEAPPIEIIEEYGVRAQMVAPIFSGGSLVAIVAVHELAGPRAWVDADVKNLEHAVAHVRSLMEGDEP